jgi:hypothetical protein
MHGAYPQYNAPQPYNQTQYAQQYQQQYGGYQDYNTQGQQPQTYGYPQQNSQKYAEGLFVQFDNDRSGDIDMMEAPRLIKAFFKMQNLPQPSRNDIQYYMKTYDYDRNGRLSYNEWRAMIGQIGGQKPNYNQDHINQKKSKGDRHHKKYKYHNKAKDLIKFDGPKFGFKSGFKGFKVKMDLFKW